MIITALPWNGEYTFFPFSFKSRYYKCSAHILSYSQLVRIFEEQKEFEKKGRLQQFDPESAIFVCNKWDQVPPNEERGVWEDITKKIKAHWPTRRDMDITRQMFKMSTTEVSGRPTRLRKF